MLPAAPCDPPFLVASARVGHGAFPPVDVGEATGGAARLGVASGGVLVGVGAAVVVLTVGLAECATAVETVCEPDEHPARRAPKQAARSTGSAGIRVPVTLTRVP